MPQFLAGGRWCKGVQSFRRQGADCRHLDLDLAKIHRADDRGHHGTFYASWLTEQGEKSTAGVKQARARSVMRPIRDESPNAVAVLKAIYVARQGTAVVGQVRRRVQRATLHRRWRHKLRRTSLPA
jgi:hypothetical protein